MSVLTCAAEAVAAYQEVSDRFASFAPRTPGWESLAADLSPAAVLGRACLHALARSLGSDRSAERAGSGTSLPGCRAGRG